MRSLRFLAAVFFTLAWYKSGFAQPLSEKDLRDFRGGVYTGCFNGQRSRDVNRFASDAQIRLYCSCFTQSLANSSTTIQDVQRALEMRKRSEEAMLNHLLKGRDLYTVANQCANDAIRGAR